MKTLLASTLQLAGSLLRNRIVLIALAVLLAAGIAWYVWVRKRKSTTGGGAATGNGGSATGVLRQIAPVNAGYIDGVAIPPHPGTPDLLRIELFPEFYFDGFFVWSSHLFNDDFGTKLLKRGVSHVETQQAVKTATPTTKAQRFAIMYRDSFNGIEFKMANIEGLKGAVDGYVGGQFGGQIDILGYDPENDQQTPDYGEVVRQLSLHAREKWGIRMVDFVGLMLANTDWNVNNQPPSQTFYAPYLDDETTFDDVVPYFSRDQIETGDWLYSVFRTTRLYRAVFPNRILLSYWWHFAADKSIYVPNHVAESTAIMAWMAGGGYLLNWEDGAKGYIFAADEHLINGKFRLAKANALRQGPVRFYVPEISTDGGASWRYNDEITAKANGDPMIGLSENKEGWLLAGHASRLPSGEQKIMVRAENFPARTITLKAKQTYLEAIL